MGTNITPYQPKSRIGRFFDERLPLPRLIYNAFVAFPVPRNLNYFYTFGGILTLVLLSQVLTGIVLAMHYMPDITEAFSLREHLARDVPFGYLFEPWHAVGASFFFIAAYIHLARGLYYGSHRSPRELVWVIGVLIYLTMMATAFFGYVLVWGMMSSSAASVVTGFFKAVPWVGEWLYETFVGGYAVGQPTLSRFYTLHYLFPFILIFWVVLHIWAVHKVGQGNPTGLEVRSQKEVMPFSPYALVKDIFAITVFLLFFSWFLFYMPDYMGHPDNFIEADLMKTSVHIVPEWYFLPFYAMLRAITFDIGFIHSTFAGVLVLAAAVLVLFFVPWLDRGKTHSGRYRPFYQVFFWLFVADFIFLGWVGSRPIEPFYVHCAQIGTLYYFAFFLVVMPFLPFFEKIKTPPSSIAADIAAKSKRGAK